MKKLSLNKETIANLNCDIMNNVKGGGAGVKPRPTLEPCLITIPMTNCVLNTCIGQDTCDNCTQGTLCC